VKYVLDKGLAAAAKLPSKIHQDVFCGRLVDIVNGDKPAELYLSDYSALSKSGDALHGDVTSTSSMIVHDITDYISFGHMCVRE
jgi:hypothetical protein